MNYLSVENLSKSFGDLDLFEDLNFGLNKGDKTALIANNGAGKSSLLNILMDKEPADTGTVVYRDGIKIAYLEQNPVFDDSLSINELIEEGNSEIIGIIHEYETALEKQTENFTSKTKKEFEEASAKMDKSNAWDYERRMKQILSLFNIIDLNKEIGLLSGGQKKRLALAIVLLDNPDLLILDEPTNHLDINMIEWLEKYLLTSSITLFMVTHDRYFLDRVCNHILELNDGKIFHHNGNYAYYVEKSAEREEVEKTEIIKARRLLRKELEWMRRMPQARTTKSKARIDSFYETKEKASSQKIKQELKLDVKMSRVGGKILEIKNIKKAYGEIKILDNFEYIFKKGERIGIIGKNGVGKTSLLNMITGLENPDSGSIIKGETISFGYYSQEGIKFREDQRVIDILKDIAEIITLSKGNQLTASQFLQHFMFPPKMQFQTVSTLSGGERRRLYLLTILMKNPNFLILDEPTNDLDILTLNKLEDFLLNFKGCLVIVSHDRYFLDKLCDHLFLFKGDESIKDFYGNYTQYRNKEYENEKLEKKQKAIQKKNEIKEKTKNKPKEKTKLNFKEKREYESLQVEIDNLEKEKAELEIILSSGSDNYEDLEKASSRISVIIDLIDDKIMRWMELGEFV